MDSKTSISDATKEAKKEEKKGDIILNRYCDKAMAMKRKLLPCEHNCRTCIACIEVTDGGEKRHFSAMRARQGIDA